MLLLTLLETIRRLHSLSSLKILLGITLSETCLPVAITQSVECKHKYFFIGGIIVCKIITSFHLLFLGSIVNGI